MFLGVSVAKVGTKKLQPARKIEGTVVPPGDKSISHRYAILGAMAEGKTEIRNFSPSRDCAATLNCLRKLGVKIVSEGECVTIEGVGLRGFKQPDSLLDAENSGTTMRLLAGVLAAQAFDSTLAGDASLSLRPMARLIEPLAQMGARIRARDDNYPPLEISGRPLQSIAYRMPLASAQVKSAILLAGLLAPGETVVEEPVRTRDHTELALREFGAEVIVRKRVISVRGSPHLEAKSLVVPGDFSAAMFFLAAVLLIPDANLVISNVGLNPTRTAALDFLASLGGRIKILGVEQANGELVGDLHVEHSTLKGGEISGEQVAAMIDELPILAVIASEMQDGLRIRDAAELRVKESDRLGALAENLRRMGARVSEYPDGLDIEGQQALTGAEIESFSDHRIAMAFSIAALIARGETLIRQADCVDVSYPGFYEALEKVVEF